MVEACLACEGLGIVKRPSYATGELIDVQCRICQGKGLLEEAPVDMFKDITDFHQKFKLTYTGQPRELPDDLFWFRSGFLDEEVKEYLRGWQEGNLEKQFDALVDIVYVVMGTAYLHGFNWNEAWKRVHACNMQKIRAKTAEESERGSTHDVVKPEGWEPPVYGDLMTMHQGKDGVYTIVGAD